MGIMTPEVHMHELTKRNDEWVKRDISQKGKYQLIRASRGNNMPEDSVQKNALNLLSQFAYENWFEKAYIRLAEYSTTTIYEEDADGHRVIAGNRVSHKNFDSDSQSLYIPKNGRCPKPWCVCHDIQCVHEFAIDKRFILNKWSTRWWSDGTYEATYGIYGNEFIGKRNDPPKIDIPAKITSPERGNAQPTVQNQDIPGDEQNIPQYIVPTPAYRRRNKKVEFNELINMFSTLASDILNRSPLASQLLHGFICKTQQMISDLPSVKLDNGLSGLMTSTSNTIMQSLTGIMDQEISGNSEERGEEGTADDISLLHPPQPCQPNDLKCLPPTGRPTVPGRPQHKRFKGAAESRKPVSNLRKPRVCAFCSRPKHTIATCEMRICLGRFLSVTEFQQYKHDLQSRGNTHFDTTTIKDGEQTVLQVPNQTKYLCIHGYAFMTNNDGSPFLSDRAESHFLCVTYLYDKGVILDTYKKCYVSTGAVTIWIDHAKNRWRNLLVPKEQLLT